jgi:hypothetical protein
LCWGGSTAIERSGLDGLDLALTKALRMAGIPVHSTTRVLVPSSVLYLWSSVFSFGGRQYLLLRYYAPRHWLLAG